MLYILVPLLLMIGCAAELPVILEPENAPVFLVSKQAEIPEGCNPLGFISERDGEVGDSRYAYNGTRERALARLRNRARDLGATYVLLQPELDTWSSITDVPSKISVRVNGIAYCCRREPSEPKNESREDWERVFPGSLPGEDGPLVPSLEIN